MRKSLRLGLQRALLSIERLSLLLNDPAPGDLAELVDSRWNLARQVLAHFDMCEAGALAVLERDERPGVAETVSRLRAEREELALRFQGHARRFWTEDMIRADREAYHASLVPLLAELTVLLKGEEAVLAPLLEGMPEPGTGAERRWQSEAWKYRSAAPSGR